jgi:hypothetical protein
MESMARDRQTVTSMAEFREKLATQAMRPGWPGHACSAACIRKEAPASAEAARIAYIKVD